VVSPTDPHGRNLGFLDPGVVSFPFKQLLNCTHEAEWTPFQTHYFSENLIAPGIEPGTSGSVARNCQLITRRFVISEASINSILYTPVINLIVTN
jgi:hypothetical protein